MTTVDGGTGEIIRAEPTPVVEVAAWRPQLVSTVEEAVAQVEMRRDFMKRVMKKGIDYGEMPGTKPKEGEAPKQVLWKAGAENLLANFGLHPEFPVDLRLIEEDWTGERHAGEIFLSYTVVCKVYRQTGVQEGERMLIASASGACNSWETKYRYRHAQRLCPICGQAEIRKSKSRPTDPPDTRQGWYCWNNPAKGANGCGATFSAGDPAIEDQEVGRVPNPDVADLANTLLKMAEKRALVGATLLATGFSSIFTQDVGEEGQAQAAESRSAAPRTARGAPVVHEGVAREVPPRPESGAITEGPACPLCGEKPMLQDGSVWVCAGNKKPECSGERRIVAPAGSAVSADLPF